jgi:hypothetical protein
MKKNVTLIRLMVSYLFLVNIAYATVWYVHPDSIMNCIQDGLDSCSTGDTVLVGPGTYYENIIWPNTQGIDLISEYGPDSTILDGDSTGSVLTVANGMDTNTIIIDFTIRNGLAQIGGGILCSNHSAPKICGNIIISNITTHNIYNGGAGIACIDSSAPIISDNTIQSNEAYSSGGGIMCNNNSSPIIRNNVITSNIAWYGAGIFCRDYSSPIIAGNTICYNQFSSIENIGLVADYSRKVPDSIDFKRTPFQGGGICLFDGCASLIDSNSLFGNSAMSMGGGISCLFSPATICHNTIYENIADYHGGGISCVVESGVTISGNIITANESQFGGGISVLYSSQPHLIINNTVSNNNCDGVYCDQAVLIINYNNIINNVGYGVHNVWSGITVNAEYNWWGDSTGPYHPVSNPGGLGDSVSDYVDYDPWLLFPGIEEYEPSQPVSTVLQISPNPFSKLTKISFGNVQGAKSIELKVYDATGRMVKDFKHVINQQIFWNGTDDLNRKLPSGVYFLKLVTGDYSATEKLLLIR